MNRTVQLVALAALVGIACADKPPATAQTDVPPPSTPAVDETAEADESAEPEPKPEPEKPPEPKLVAPDGTEILPCEDPPEGMACIPGGPFIRGSDDGPKKSRPAATVWLQTFYMDINEVTTAEYDACEAAKKCSRAGPLYNDFSRDKQPIVGTNWYHSVKYCKAHGKHLPTEAQWEKAARGPDGKVHPWGDEPATCELAIIKDHRGRSCGVKKKKEHPDKGRTFEIGSRPPGVYGLYDMSGNSWEWVADWASNSYDKCGKACEGTDPLGPCGGREPCPGRSKRIVRGGSWYWPASHATGFYRRFHFPANEPYHHFGFRCAASLEEARAMRDDAASGAKPPGDSPSG